MHVGLSVCLSVCPSVCLPVCLSVCCLCVHPSVCLFACLNACVSVCLHVFLLVCQSFSLSVSFFWMSVCLFVCLSVCLVVDVSGLILFLVIVGVNACINAFEQHNSNVLLLTADTYVCWCQRSYIGVVKKSCNYLKSDAERTFMSINRHEN